MQVEEILIPAAVLLTVFVMPVIPGWVARRKNRSFAGWYSVSLLLSFVPSSIPGFAVGLLALYMLPPLDGKVSRREERSLLMREWRSLTVPAICAVTVVALCCVALWLAYNMYFSRLAGTVDYRPDFRYVGTTASVIALCLLIAAVIYQAVLVYKRRIDSVVDISLLSSAVVIFFFSIISYAFWSNEAWGTYWAWDPKETWEMIIIGTSINALILNVIGRALEPSRRGLVIGLVSNAVVVITIPVVVILVDFMMLRGCHRY